MTVSVRADTLRTMRPSRLVPFLFAAPALTACAPDTWAGQPSDGADAVVDEEGGRVELPPSDMQGFSYVDDRLAGMPQPGMWRPLAVDLAFLAEEIDLLVSLTTTPPPTSMVESAGLAHAHIPIVDMTPPTLDQQLEFVALLDDAFARGETVGVHCLAGKGRTGTMLATWFVRTGLSADDAIAHVRSARPGSIETPAQEQAVHTYAAHRATMRRVPAAE